MTTDTGTALKAIKWIDLLARKEKRGYVRLQSVVARSRGYTTTMVPVR